LRSRKDDTFVDGNTEIEEKLQSRRTDKMIRVSERKKFMAGAIAVLSAGSVAAIFPSCETIATSLNPCGSVFGFCEPNDVVRMFGSIPDYDIDPTCTLPLFGVESGNQQGGGGGGGGGGGQQNLGTCTTTPVYPFTPGPRPE
jgi:hypothetical protein